jgi:nucleoid DNA-binding protein
MPMTQQRKNLLIRQTAKEVTKEFGREISGRLIKDVADFQSRAIKDSIGKMRETVVVGFGSFRVNLSRYEAKVARIGKEIPVYNEKAIGLTPVVKPTENLDELDDLLLSSNVTELKNLRQRK